MNFLRRFFLLLCAVVCISQTACFKTKEEVKNEAGSVSQIQAVTGTTPVGSNLKPPEGYEYLRCRLGSCTDACASKGSGIGVPDSTKCNPDCKDEQNCGIPCYCPAGEASTTPIR